MNSYTFEPMGIDETHAECVDRVAESGRYTLRLLPSDQDAHVRAWESDRLNKWLDRLESELYTIRETKWMQS